MAKIILISNDSHVPGLNNIGDIVEIVDDDVGTGGPGYANFRIAIVAGLTAAQIRARLKDNWPDRKRIGNDRYWQNPDDLLWYKIQIVPKYHFSLKDLSQQDLSKLQQGNVTPEEKLGIIGTVPAQLTAIEENNTITE